MCVCERVCGGIYTVISTRCHGHVCVGESVCRWIVNLPYQSDILWWFKEVQRREGVAGDGAGKLVRVLNSYVPKSQKEEVLQNDVGLFTGETLIHIAIQRSLHFSHTHAHTHAHTHWYA